MRSVKDPLGLNVPEVYKIPYMCGAWYIGQTGRIVNIRANEHQRHVRFGNTEKSALAHHCWMAGHHIQFDRTELLYKSPSWNVRLIRESLETAITQGAIIKKTGTNWVTHGSWHMGWGYHKNVMSQEPLWCLGVFMKVKTQSKDTQVKGRQTLEIDGGAIKAKFVPYSWRR